MRRRVLEREEMKRTITQPAAWDIFTRPTAPQQARLRQSPTGVGWGIRRRDYGVVSRCHERTQGIIEFFTGLLKFWARILDKDE